MLPESHPLYATQIFFQILFQHAPSNHWIEFRGIWDKNHRTKPAPDGKHAVVNAVQVEDFEKSFDLFLADWIMNHNKAEYDIYFGVCPREKMARTASKGYVKAGGNESVTHAVCAWVDYDKNNFKHFPTENPRPSIMVSTGHGAHLYYRYKEVMPILKATKDSETLAKKYDGDSCYDAARILRVPGTRNWKEPDKKLWATIEHLDPEIFFDQVVEFDPSQKPKTLFDLPYDLRTLIMKGHSAAEERFLKGAQKPEGGVDQSAVDFRAMSECMDFGITDEMILDWWTNKEYGISAKFFSEGPNGPHYIQRTLEKVKGEYEKRAQQYSEIGDIIVFESTSELKQAPPLTFAVQGMLPVYGMMLVSGPAKTGKSLIVNDLAFLLAGVPGLFMEQFKVLKPGTVVYCQAEISRGSLKDRLDKIVGSRGVKWENFPVHFLNRNFDLGNMKHVYAMINSLKKVRADYLIVDPFARFHRMNENRANDMADVLSNLAKIARDSGLLGTVLVHHHGKPVEGDAGRQGVQNLRGTTVIGDWANSYMILSKHFNRVTGKKYVNASFELRDADEPRPIDMMINGETLRFEAFVDEDDKKLIVKQVLGAGLSKEDQVQEIRKRLRTTVQEAQRLRADVLFHPEETKAGNIVPADQIVSKQDAVVVVEGGDPDDDED